MKLVLGLLVGLVWGGLFAALSWDFAGLGIWRAR